jgi:hypothetical protein
MNRPAFRPAREALSMGFSAAREKRAPVFREKAREIE